jgi:hypothetical protein
MIGMHKIVSGFSDRAEALSLLFYYDLVSNINRSPQ